MWIVSVSVGEIGSMEVGAWCISRSGLTPAQTLSKIFLNTSCKFRSHRHAVLWISRAEQLTSHLISVDAEENATSASRQYWKWRMVLAYDGTNYAGWQRQSSSVTVQECIENALFKLTQFPRDELLVAAAGRTDAGVHAWGQVVHFVTPFDLQDFGRFHASLNSILPHDIRIRQISAVRPEFHARFSALTKTYQYKVFVGPVLDPFQRFYAYHVPYMVNVSAMQEAASKFVGKHDFTAFANTSRSVMVDPIRKISKFNVTAMNAQVLLEVEGTGFFYKQVRNMVGLLLEIGKGTLPTRAVSDLLTLCSRKKLSAVANTAPALGLCLMSVSYDEAVAAPSDSRQKESSGELRQLKKCQLYLPLTSQHLTR